jgi:MscS family membrane protein
VRLNNFSESSLDILVLFYLNVQDYTSELSEREVILLQTMDLAREIGVEFAFPTRTLQIENASPDTRTVKDRPVSLIDRWNRGSPDGGAEAQR